MRDVVDDRSAADKRAEQRQWREFVRTHHPDAGGDPAEFRAGVEERARRLHGRSPSPSPIVAHRRRGLAAAIRRWLDAPHLPRRSPHASRAK